MPTSDIDGLRAQAQDLQDQLISVRDGLAVLTFTGTAAGGAVSVSMTATGEFRSVAIDDEVVAGGREEVEEAVLLALRDASGQLREHTTRQLAGLQELFRPAGSD